MTFLTKFLHKFLPYLVAIIGFVSVLLIADAFRQNEQDALIAQVEQHKKVATVALREAEENKKTIVTLEKQTTDLQVLNSTLQKQLKSAQEKSRKAFGRVSIAKDSLKTALTVLDSNMVLTTIVEKQDIVITSQAAEILVLTSQNHNLTRQIALKDSINTFLVADVDRLTKVVETTPKVDKCRDKFLFCKVNKPSRTTAFLSGLGTAFIGGLALR